jgi:hypothetical protein
MRTPPVIRAPRRRRLRWPTTTLAAALVIALAAGCGGGPTPAAWAASVCEALGPWRAAIGDLTVRTQQQMTAETTPAQAQENLVRLFDGAHAASERARAGVERAGVPDVDGGEAVRERFTTSLARARDAYGHARDAIAALETNQATGFYDRVTEVVRRLGQEYAGSALDTTNLESPELRRAFDEVPECH